MNPMPLLFYPTSSAFLDDESSFLEHVDVGLEGMINNTHFLTSPKDALDFIEKYGIASLNHTDGVRREENSEGVEECILSIQTQNLHQRMRDSKTSQAVLTAVVDYHMGDINGLACCERIKNPFVQKILLTAVADEQMAIEALNHGWIDQYVRKQDPQMLSKLAAAIRRAQRQGFSKLTQGLHFAITQTPEDTAIGDPIFENYFSELIESHQIVEYYLIENMGSFLLVDAHGKRSCLFTQTQAKAESNLRLLEDCDMDKKTMSGLGSFRKIICCPSSKSFVTPSGADCERYLFPAQKLEGRQTYYLAMTPDLIGHDND